MGFFSYLKKQIIGEEGIKVLDRYPKWDKEIKEHSYKKVKLVSENRKLQREGLYLRKYIMEHNLLPMLDEKYIHTSPAGNKSLIGYGPGLPTEEYFILSPMYFELVSLTSEQKKVIDEFGIFELSKYEGGICVNRKELAKIITVLGGIKQADVDKFESPRLGDIGLSLLINTYNKIEEDTDEYSDFIDENEQEVYSGGIRYISIWLFKRNYGISPNTNKDNYINSEEIFNEYPSLETIEIEIHNRNFEYVLGYPEKILIEYFKVIKQRNGNKA